MARGDAIARFAELAREAGLEMRLEGEMRLYLYIPGIASVTIEETESATLMVAIWVRSTSNDWPGERTDLNELFAMMISLVLHNHGLSTQHILVGHPAVDLPGEVYATYLVPRQPYPTGFPTSEAGIAQVGELILDVSLTAHLAAMVLEACGWDRVTEGTASQSLSPSDEAWVGLVEKVLEVGRGVTYNARLAPTWLYLRAEPGLSIFRSEELSGVLAAWFGHDVVPRYDGPTGSVLKRGSLLNFVRRTDLEMGRQTLASLGEDPDVDLLVRAVENRVLVVAEEHALIWAADASRSAAVEERTRIAARHASEHALLFESAKVRWSERVEAGRFEQLVKQLLEQEPGVQRVRFAGATHEQDGGRDLLVEWDTPLLPSELDPDAPSPAYRTRRVVVQCKSDAAAVGIRRVSGVGDTLDQYQADGYLLVVRSRLTRPLVDRLDQRRAAGTAWVEWWGSDELERRLLAQRHVTSKFPDLVAVKG